MNNTEQKRKTGMARLYELAFVKKGLIIGAGFFSVLGAAVSFTPFVAIYCIIRELAFNMGSPGALDAGRLINLGWLAGGGAVGAIALNYAALMCSHFAAFKTLYKLKLDFTRHLASLPLGFHNWNSTGKLRKVVDVNIEKLETFIAHQLPDLIGTFSTPVIAIVLLFVFDWRMGLACLAPLLLLFVIQGAVIGGKKGRENIKKFQDSLEEMNNAAVEYVRGVSVVKAFNQTIFSFRKFYDSIKNYGDYVWTYTKEFKWTMVLFLVVLHNLYLFLVPVFIWLSGGVSDYPAFAFSMLFYTIFSMALPGLFLKIIYVSSRGKTISDGIERMDRVLNAAPLKETERPLTVGTYDLSFENLTFSYGEGEAVSNISFTANQGEVTALVGPSGSGKSTIAHLIPRFYDPNEGAIKIGGVDIRDMSNEYLMSIVSFVFHDVFLFKQSILDNIKIGNKNAGREEVIAAAKAAQCHDFIEKLPEGYDTVTGRENIHLSGGERQRIVIARAVLKDAPIIVLDEATAFADPENEHRIQLAFESLMKNKTVVIIAHRLSTVRGANKIVVIDRGRIVEEGRHDDLIKIEGRYRRMWDQFSKASGWTIAKEKNHA